MSNRSKVLLIGGLFAAGAALASQIPLAVSPGHPEELVFIESRCPTFSWTAVSGAESYQLIVYPLDEGGVSPEPVVLERFPGAVTTWTPSLERCLERKRRYAWSVRAEKKDVKSEWSPAVLFQVAAGPADTELQQALEVVRRYLAAEEARIASSPGAAPDAVVTAAPGGANVATRAAAAEVKILVTDGDIGVTSPSAGALHAYLQMDTLSGVVPNSTDCNSTSERGRMILRRDTNALYVCSNSGWVSK